MLTINALISSIYRKGIPRKEYRYDVKVPKVGKVFLVASNCLFQNNENPQKQRAGETFWLIHRQDECVTVRNANKAIYNV